MWHDISRFKGYFSIYLLLSWDKTIILRETVKKQIDSLNENQLSRLAEYISSLTTQAKIVMKTTPFWQSATPKERAQDFLAWVSGLNKTGPSLPDEAFDRASIYES